MLLISMTANASPARGYTETETQELLDLFDSVLEDESTAESVDRMLEILEGGHPISATMHAQMRPVRLDPLAKFADKFWRGYRAKHPQPARRKGIETRVDISPLSRQRS